MGFLRRQKRPNARRSTHADLRTFFSFALSLSPPPPFSCTMAWARNARSAHSSVGVDGVDIVPGMGSNVGNVMSTCSCGMCTRPSRRCAVVHSETWYGVRSYVVPRNCAHYLVPIICMNVSLSTRGRSRKSFRKVTSPIFEISSAIRFGGTHRGRTTFAHLPLKLTFPLACGHPSFGKSSELVPRGSARSTIDMRYMRAATFLQAGHSKHTDPRPADNPSGTPAPTGCRRELHGRTCCTIEVHHGPRLPHHHEDERVCIYVWYGKCEMR